MKYSAFILIVLTTVAGKISAQIPNGGFENWALSGNCWQPQGWAGMNDWMGLTENCYSMSRSDDHYPPSVGNYSIKIENNVSVLPDWGAAGMIWTGDSTGFGTDSPAFPVSGHPTFLRGYYKFLPQNGDSMDIHFQFYKNGVEVVGGKLIGTATVTDWTSFKIPVSDPDYPEVDSARIMISAFYSDSFTLHGNSVLYVDNLSFDTLISSVDEKASQFTVLKLSPNPAGNTVALNLNKKVTGEMVLDIYNQIGVLVRSEKLKQNQKSINTADLREGMYYVVLLTKDITVKQKLVIQR
jgi:hypothetical protein